MPILMDTKPAKVRATIEYTVQVPASWDKHMVEFHRNDGTWCADNMVAELQELIDEERDTCLCDSVKFECIEV